MPARKQTEYNKFTARNLKNGKMTMAESAALWRAKPHHAPKLSRNDVNKLLNTMSKSKRDAITNRYTHSDLQLQGKGFWSALIPVAGSLLSSMFG